MPALPSLRRRPEPLRDRSLFRRPPPRPEPAGRDRQLRLPLGRAQATATETATHPELVAPVEAEAPAPAAAPGLPALLAGLAGLAVHGGLLAVGMGVGSVSQAVAGVGGMAAAVGLPMLLMGPLLPVLAALVGMRSPALEVGASAALGVQRAGWVAGALALPLAVGVVTGGGEVVAALVLPCLLLAGALGLGATVARVHALELVYDPDHIGASVATRRSLRLWAGATGLVAGLSVARFVLGALS